MISRIGFRYPARRRRAPSYLAGTFPSVDSCKALSWCAVNIVKYYSAPFVFLFPLSLAAQLLPLSFNIHATAADAAGAMYFAGDVSPSDATAGGATQLQPLSSDCGLSGQFVFSCTHGYIAKVAPGGDRILWSSTFGGDGVDSITKLSVASDGAVVFAGSTTSKSLPLTGYQRTPGSMFVARLSADGRTILAGTYFGGSPSAQFNDTLGAMRVDSSGNVYIAGAAYSDPFPTTPGAFRRDHIPPSTTNSICRGAADQFITKFDPALSRLVFSTLAGTDGNDQAYDLAIRSDGTFYVAGNEGNNRVCEHPTLAHFSADASTVLYNARPVLGPTPTGAYAVAIDDATGDAYLVADTRGFIPPERGGIWRIDTHGVMQAFVEVAGGIGDIAVAANGDVVVAGQASPLGLAVTAGAPRTCVLSDSVSAEFSYLARFNHATLIPIYEGFLNGSSVGLVGPDRLIVRGLYTSADGFQMIRPEPPPAGTITCIANAATYDPFYLSPGEIATIFGNQIGPVQPASAQLDAAGNVATMLAGMQILVNGVPAPVLYASSGQINFVTPFATPPTGTVAVELRRNGTAFPHLDKFARSSHLGAFTLDSTGTGPLAALNQDQSVNSATNPADPGSVISVFVTGAGAMTPPPLDGSHPPVPVNQPVLPIDAAVNGRDAQVVYAGNAPTLVEGVVQVNVRLPDTIYRQFPFNDPLAAILRIDAGGDNLHTSAIGTIYVR